ncbi:MAG: TRIC cation channel family protein [Clostridia bacterium]|nr:TRIC cation channel family protein [Clostridia bacterium]
MGLLFSIIEFIGTITFAISGAMEAIRHKMDMFGVAMLGIVTATGGGVLRDIIIGRIPPRVFTNPRYALLAFFVALVTFILMKIFHNRATDERVRKVGDYVYFITDTAGLAAFTVAGIEAAGNGNAALLLFVGVISGVGGGVIRDVLAGTVPSIFRKHIYALAAAAGALVYTYLLRTAIPRSVSMTISFFLVVIIRVLARHFKWNLPKID